MGKLGMICLGAWLIIMGLTQAMDIKFARKDLIMGILAIIAGATVLLGLL